MRGGTKAISSKRARAALAMMLSACTVESLLAFTAERLSQSWNVPVGTVALMLEQAKTARGL
jgi:hypothetical protein